MDASAFRCGVAGARDQEACLPTWEVLYGSGGNHTKEERLGAVAQACFASTWEVNAGESGVQA